MKRTVAQIRKDKSGKRTKEEEEKRKAFLKDKDKEGTLYE